MRVLIGLGAGVAVSVGGIAVASACERAGLIPTPSSCGQATTTSSTLTSVVQVFQRSELRYGGLEMRQVRQLSHEGLEGQQGRSQGGARRGDVGRHLGWGWRIHGCPSATTSTSAPSTTTTSTSDTTTTVVDSTTTTVQDDTTTTVGDTTTTAVADTTTTVADVSTTTVPESTTTTAEPTTTTTVVTPVTFPVTTSTTTASQVVPSVQAVSNWAGYADTGKTFSSVSGTWAQPTGTCPASGDQVEGVWVGLDGVKSTSVEQTGTSFECSNGQVQEFAWYEFFPEAPVQLPAADVVVARDSITGSVVDNGGTFTLKLTDNTKGWTFSVSKTVANAPASSAEWIVEAPLLANSAQNATLPNFGTTSFTNCRVTVAGAIEPINAFANTQLELADDSGAIKAQAGALTNSGTSFTVKFVG